jgi:hypothetical protein
MNDELAELAITTFGKRHQIIKAIEELGELQTAISRYLNNEYDDELRMQMIDEIADAYILIKQLMLIFPQTEHRLIVKADKLRGHIDAITQGY